MAGLDQFQGCLLGLALGDAFGAPWEGGIAERLLWRVIGRTNRGELRWTDDTQMTIDLIESFLSTGCIEPDDMAIRFARSYRWSRGYGPAAAKVLKRIARGTDWRQASRSVYAGGSYGNGAAMRAPILGLIFANRADEIAKSARLTGMVTHAHPLALEGAVLVALATDLAASGIGVKEILVTALPLCVEKEFTSRLMVAQSWLESETNVPPVDVIRQLGHGIPAHLSCVTAVYLALRYRDRPFEELLAFTVSLGGDVDTIGAMAGAIWGAANGFARLPANSLSRLEQFEWLMALAELLHRQAGEPPTKQTSANR